MPTERVPAPDSSETHNKAYDRQPRSPSFDFHQDRIIETEVMYLSVSNLVKRASNAEEVAIKKPKVERMEATLFCRGCLARRIHPCTSMNGVAKYEMPIRIVKKIPVLMLTMSS